MEKWQKWFRDVNERRVCSLQIKLPEGIFKIFFGDSDTPETRQRLLRTLVNPLMEQYLEVAGQLLCSGDAAYAHFSKIMDAMGGTVIAMSPEKQANIESPSDDFTVFASIPTNKENEDSPTIDVTLNVPRDFVKKIVFDDTHVGRAMWSVECEPLLQAFGGIMGILLTSGNFKVHAERLFELLAEFGKAVVEANKESPHPVHVQ